MQQPSARGGALFTLSIPNSWPAASTNGRWLLLSSQLSAEAEVKVVLARLPGVLQGELNNGPPLLSAAGQLEGLGLGCIAAHLAKHSWAVVQRSQRRKRSGMLFEFDEAHAARALQPR